MTPREPGLLNAVLVATVVLMLLLAPASVAVSCVDVPPGIVSWWPLEGDGTDIVRGNHGSLSGGVQTTAGLVGQALSFDGTGAVLVPHSPNLNVQACTFTIDAWVNPTVLDGTIHMILNKEEVNVITEIEYEIGIRGDDELGIGTIPPGNLAFFIGGITGLPDEYRGWVDGNHNIPLGTWTHVALTFHYNTATVYVNGQQTRVLEGLSGPVETGTGSLRIGARSSTYHHFKGTIDEVDFFNNALHSNEVWAIYSAGSEGKCTSLTAIVETRLLDWTLDQNHPNPFNPSTTISFTLPERTAAKLSIYDIEGKLVTTLVADTLDGGFKEVVWDGKDFHGNQVSTGVYFYRLTAGNRTLTKKMVLLK